jgi:hypothetical protein
MVVPMLSIVPLVKRAEIGMSMRRHDVHMSAGPV